MIAYNKLNHRPTAVVRGGKTYNYEVVHVPCRAKRTIAPIRIPWHQATGESDKSYESRLRYSRPWGPSSRIGARLRGVRSNVEARFSMIDNAFPFKRIPAYSVKTKMNLMYGYAHGHNLCMAGLEQKRAGP